jgi:PAS domain S-box-containing protein
MAIARYWDRTVLVLEDPGGVPLDQLLGQPLDVAFSLRLAISLSTAIGHLHQRGIIHKDIKPANVLVNSVTGQCWLMGFGMASRLLRERQSPEPPEFVAGTLPYMAPEQTGRMNRSIDSRSDLYSLGITLYEMLTGILPFTASDPMEWVHCHIARQPIPPAERLKNVPAALSAIIMKLLAKTAEERYQTAAGVESDLRRCLAEWERSSDSAILRQTAAVSNQAMSDKSAGSSSGVLAKEGASLYQIEEFPLGEHDTPDRLLIPEKLYGRAREIDTLLTSFDRVVATGLPELVLVSGYSGIGKSSVVNELHKVLVPPRGLFASGKFDQYKREIPYATLAQAFQSLIRPLLSKSEAELQDWRDALHEALDPNGKLIVDLMPELKLIIGEQPPLPDLPPQDAQRRFQLVFRRFISVFAQREHPLALFVDDLQWLDAATLDLLEDLLTSDFANQESPIPQGDSTELAEVLCRGQPIGCESPKVAGRAVVCEGGSQPTETKRRRTGRPDVRYLMLIGAYRDNEVNSAHPLMRKLEAIRQAGAIVHEIILAPLAREDLGRLIADSLHCEPDRVIPLARLVHEKTAGNPFFAVQFISALAEEALLTFDHAGGRWSWDLSRIQAKGYTDNVADLMVGKVNRLAVETQQALQEVACLGNGAEIATLCIVHGTSEEGVHADLWDAVRLEFVVRLERSYRFVHDRVQEAAYSLIPEQLRAEAHLRIGKLLAAHTPAEKREETIFEIVNQLNRGAALITSRDEREQLAELNLIAARRAKASTAYASALNYLIAGAKLLGDDHWERRPELTFALELHRAECEFLTGAPAAAEQRLTMLSARAANTVARATVACLQVDVYTTLDQSDRAVAVCLDYLRHLGVDWSAHPTAAEARREYEWIWSQLGSRTIEELLELPLMSDPASLATLDVLTKVLPPALFSDANLLSLATCRAVNLSLKRGNSDASCVAYEWLGQIAGPHFGDYQAGFRFGRLGCELVEQRGLQRFQARTYMVFASHVMPWTKHVRAGRDLLRRAFEAANKIGDLCFATYNCINLNTNLLAAGDPLTEVQHEAQHGLEFARKARFGLAIDLITVQLGLIRTLGGMTPKFGSFNDEQFAELEFERHLASDPARAQRECCYWIRKLQARCLAGDYEPALDASLRAQRLLWSVPSNLETAEYHFYGALSRAASCDSSFAEASEDKSAITEQEALAREHLSSEVRLSRTKEEHFEALTAHHKQLEVWAGNCPENFGDRATLVAAEIARLEGRDFEAMRLYEEAIRLARANGFVHNEALANELAARFYLARGFEKIAYVYLPEARYCYLRWEAAGKVRQLEELYPQLRGEEPVPGQTSTIGASVEHLDLTTIINVSQAVSGEIVLEKLIDTLMRTAIEYAGAERGLLILPRGVEHRIEAEATTSGDQVVVHMRAASLAETAVPRSIIHYVVRTQQTVILDDAAAQNPFSTDSYIRQKRARSILCLPLINQTKLIGVLYLENNLALHVFTPARIAVLKLLAAQAAISLDNTRLYRDLAEREAKIRRLFDANIMGIYIWNLQGLVLEANEAFLHILRYSRADVVSGGLRWTDLTPPEWRGRDAQAEAELIATGTIQPFEKEYFRKDGSRVPVLLGCATFEGSGNEGVAFVLDLSEQKRAEDALRQAQAELARVSRMTTMEQLAASIAHEVNQPLGAVVTSGNACLNWLSTNPPSLRKARDAVERMVRDSNRASDVLKRVRALLKKAPLTKSPTNVNELVQEVLALVGGELRKRGVEVSAQLDLHVPAVMADFVQLQQVLLNLVMNAIESMTTVTDRPRVLQIQSRPHDLAGRSAVLVAVHDSGVGLSAEAMAGVFQAFYSTKPEGMGMGLWICRSIIEAHGGQLTAQPNDGVGATFQFVLPASAEDSA